MFVGVVVGYTFRFNFAFYAGVKSNYHNEVTLAKFIAFFLALVRIVALAIKMVLTSRLINRFGNINALLVTPVVMTVMILAIVGTQDMDAFPKMILYFFGVTSIVVDILRSSINSPVFLTLMQPLPVHERLRAHTVVKGIMDPFASLFTGLILIAVIGFHGKVSLLTLCYILLALALVWFAAIYLVNKNYIGTILRTIGTRFFNNSQVVFDRNALNYLIEKVQIGSETEALNILEMVSRNNKDACEEVCAAAITHSSENVRALALDIVAEKRIELSEDVIVQHLNDATSSILCRDSSKFFIADANIGICPLLPSSSM